MPRQTSRILLVLAILLALVLFFVFDLGQYLTLDYLKSRQHDFQQFYAEHRFITLLTYFLIYVVVTALSLPGAAVMTLAGGALFGLWSALLLVSFASSIGATLAFLASRFLLHDWVQQRFGARLKAINAGVARDGAFYLFSLRLVPVFPFFVINLVMGLTPLRTPLFYLVSQLGMLPGTLVYVNAGTQLGQLESAGGILSPGLLLSFALLGIFPLLAKKGLDILQARKVYRGYRRPSRYDYNLVVIGAGSAGLVSAYIAAAVKARVALIEKQRMGGDCLNTGCVPSKALIRSAKAVAEARRAEELGLKRISVEFDFADIMQRVQEKIARIAPHDSVERYRSLGVEVFHGEARITSPWTVSVDGRELTTRNIIVATGAMPLIPPIEGLGAGHYLTSETLWDLRELPQRLVVLGGGPIGCEMTQAFARLGSRVTQVEMGPRIMPREDPEVSTFVSERFAEEGISVLTGHRAVRIVEEAGQHQLICEADGQEVRIAFDKLLIAVGRKAHVSGFGLEELGIEIDPSGTVDTDPLLRTRFPNIFCAGDVAGPYQFTHVSAHQAWHATVNALFGRFKKFRVDYRVIPWCTFTDVEVARVGLNATDATARGVPFEVTRYEIADLDRAITDSEETGWVKVLTRPRSDKILGVTIVGAHAGDLLAEYVLAMKHGIGLNKILGTIHAYPTLAEMNKMAAGEWKRAHAPEKLLQWVARFHRWQRRDSGRHRGSPEPTHKE